MILTTLKKLELSTSELQSCDLIPETIYAGINLKNSDVLHALTTTKMSKNFISENKLDKKNNLHTSTGTNGGFRMVNLAPQSKRSNSTEHAFLVITSAEKAKANIWSDDFDSGNHLLTYHGDNKASQNIFNTPKKGNFYLDEIFSENFAQSTQAFPILYFKLFADNRVEYMGLAYPIPNGLKSIKEKNNIPNYEAKFYVDQTTSIKKEWLTHLKEGKSAKNSIVPQSWSNFIHLKPISSNKKIMNKIFSLSGGQNEATVKAKERITQSQFRHTLLQKQHRCLVCGLDCSKLLIASHIKPWANSNDQEKIDSNNGLLLCAIHDKLFDKGLISFDTHNHLCVSNLLTKKDLKILHLDTSRTFAQLKGHQTYLQYHRQYVAKDILSSSNDF